ncbi:MAG: alpha/beta hydrolase [Ferruginibacter sp.]|nr:alpha/beta hydrolase [Ferruginibacter sp.]
MQTNTVNFKSSSIFYKVIGEGPVVVLVHGFGETGNVWQGQVNVLKSRFRLIIPDLPGSGLSQFVDGAGIDDYAAAIKLIVDTELAPETKASSSYQTKNISSNNNNNNNAKVAIIGHSMGGYITLAFAEKYPDLLNSFGLFHSTAMADNEEKIVAREKGIEFIKNNGPYAFIKKSTPNLFTKKFAISHPEKITALIEEAKHFTEAALVQYYECMISRPDRIHVLESCQQPVLIIAGEQDTNIPLQSLLQQSHLPLQSYFAILQQSAHMGMWEEKEKVEGILLDFLVNSF